MLERADYDSLVARFRWEIPARFNIAEACCGRFARSAPQRPAIVEAHADGRVETVTYAALAGRAGRLMNALAAHGVGRGDTLAVLLPQSADTIVAHLAAYALGAIALPLATAFGSDALAYRLADSGAKALVATAAGAARIDAIRHLAPALSFVIAVDGPAPGAVALADLAARASDRFAPAATAPDDPALLIYTSGTTGPPKGALHGHRVLLGHIPGVELQHEFLPRDGDLLWTPADWAWAGGLLNVVLPGLFLGVPVVAYATTKFDPERAFALMAETGVRNAFLPPTALRIMRSAPPPRLRPQLRTVGAAGEALGSETYEWGRETFGVPVNEFYGQTECNAVIASCAGIGVSRAGATGKPVPGHDVVLVDAEGRPVGRGTPGEIAVRRPDPVMFLGYLHQPEATAGKFLGDLMLTGDAAVMDADGYIHFIGRTDDLITSAGYRIGPGEVEDCLVGHPAVHLAAVVGKPDPVRTEIVCAYVALAPGYAASDALAAEIVAHVRARLSQHEYPREVHFVDDVPLTTTGKVIRRHFRAAAAGGPPCDDGR